MMCLRTHTHTHTHTHSFTHTQAHIKHKSTPEVVVALHFLLLRVPLSLLFRELLVHIDEVLCERCSLHTPRRCAVGGRGAQQKLKKGDEKRCTTKVRKEPNTAVVIT